MIFQKLAHGLVPLAARLGQASHLAWVGRDPVARAVTEELGSWKVWGAGVSSGLPLTLLQL